MRSKNVHRAPQEEEPASASGGVVMRRILTAVVLLALGASFAVVAGRLASGNATASPAASPTASPAASTALASGSPSATGSPAASPSPSPSPSPAAPALEALMPKSINGTTMTVQSATDVAALGNNPQSRALSAAVKSAGKDPATFEAAAAYDPAGALRVSTLGFRLPGVDAKTLRPVVLNAWLAAGVPGVKSSEIKLGSTPATKVSYGDGGADEYVVLNGDAVLVIETADEALAIATAAALPAPSAAPSPGASQTPSQSPTPSPSPSPSA